MIVWLMINNFFKNPCCLHLLKNIQIKNPSDVKNKELILAFCSYFGLNFLLRIVVTTVGVTLAQ